MLDGFVEIGWVIQSRLLLQGKVLELPIFYMHGLAEAEESHRSKLWAFAGCMSYQRINTPDDMLDTAPLQRSRHIIAWHRRGVLFSAWGPYHQYVLCPAMPYLKA